MAKVQFGIVGAMCLVLSSLVVGCDTEDDRISELDSLRIIAVRSDKSYTTPSSTVQLEMLVNDGSSKAIRKDGTKRDVRLLWFGSCVNPDGDLYYNCFPQLREQLKHISDAELNAGEITDNTVKAKLGFGQSYQLAVPSDVISARPPAPRIAYPYGVVVLFYAACAGELRVERDADVETEYPVGCYDPDTNEALGQSDFEFGFYPIYAYESLVNQVPIISSAEFTVKATGKVCNRQEDCASDEACGTGGLCIPRVTACENSKKCSDYTFKVVVDDSSIESAASAYISEATAPPETLWISYYADLGEFEKDARIIYDSASGFTGDYKGVWSPKVDKDAPSTPREAHLYAVVRDNRGGVTWVTQDVYVE